MDPQDLLSFFESEVFLPAWKRAGLDDRDLFELQGLVIAHPKGAPVVEGTGGLRKMRFSPKASPFGKSGSHRALYVYFEEYHIVFLVTAYSKRRKDTLSAAAKTAIRRMIAEQHELLSRGPVQ